MRHYEIPKKFISLIKGTYQGMSCRVVHACQLSEKSKWPQVFSKDGYYPCFSFYWWLTGLWKQKQQAKRMAFSGIHQYHWKTLLMRMILPCYHTIQAICRTKRHSWQATPQKFSMKKTKILRTNITSNIPILLEKESIAEVESFKYLGSIVDKAVWPKT